VKPKSNKTNYGADGFSRPSRSKQPRRQTSRSPILSQPGKSGNTTRAKVSGQPAFAQYYSPYTAKRTVTQQKRPKIRPGWFKRHKIITAVLAILLLGFGVGSWYGAQIIGNLDKVFHGNVFTDAKALFSQTKLKGEDQGRVNILLAGDSADDPNHGGAQLTDSIMIVSIDTKTHTGFMLSIPRDLWVDIPGWSHQKINVANEVNNFNQAGYPKGGMGQLEEIVQNNLGIPIDYYALINYTAFRDAVNSVGGVTINIQSPDPRGLYDPNISKADGGPLKLPNGTVTLNGQTALNLARARGDPCGCGSVEYGFPQSDYNRTQHQRQMLTALAQKAQSAGVLANPIKITNLFNSFGNNVATDLNIQDVLRFIQVTKGMNINSLQSLALSNSGSKPLLTGYFAPDGEEALIPIAGVDNFGQIQQYYQQLTSDNPVVKEAPSVVVLNGSGIIGLAHKDATLLKSEGFNVVGTADANGQYASSLIIDMSNGKKPASRQVLQSLSKGAGVTASINSSTEATEAQGYNADFVIVLGQNSSQQP
jgi:LCP family protein required for cell wall assembly